MEHVREYYYSNKRLMIFYETQCEVSTSITDYLLCSKYTLKNSKPTLYCHLKRRLGRHQRYFCLNADYLLSENKNHHHKELYCMEFTYHLLENVSHSVITSTILSGPAHWCILHKSKFNINTQDLSFCVGYGEH